MIVKQKVKNSVKSEVVQKPLSSSSESGVFGANSGM